jgi:D-alanine-D-alanine ligase-like ATP-grasp enzyme
MKTTFAGFLQEAKTSKKLLLAVNISIPEFVQGLKKKYKDQVEFVDFKESFSFDLANVGFVLIGLTGKHPKEFNKLIKILKSIKINYFVYGAKNPEQNKDAQFKHMEKAGISQIPSMFGNPKNLDVDSLIKKFGLPLVVKPIDGSQGNGVKLLKTKKQLENYLEKSSDSIVTVQKFIENDGDWRLLFVGNKLIYSILRKTVDEKEFRNNTSLGGKATNKKPPANVLVLAKKANLASGLDITGVDIIEDKNSNDVYVMEVNAGPQFFSNQNRFNSVINAIFEKIKF